MKNFLKIFSVFLLLSANFYEAQQVVQQDTISGTPLTIMMDQKVNDLLASVEDKCATSINKTASNSDTNWSGDTPRATTPKISVPERELSNAEICRRNPRIMGFKIQLAVVKSNKEADEVALYFRRRFPNIKTEKDASLRPNYKVLAGSYFTKQGAADDLSRVRKYFKDAISVQYRVFCVEAK